MTERETTTAQNGDGARRVAIVTGGGRGIGRATSRALAKRGIRLVVVYRSDQNAADEVVREVIADGGDALAIRSDVTSESDVQALIEATVDRFGTIDILVNNAGSVERADILDVSIQDWERILSSNLTSAFLCTRAVLPIMLKNRYGRIVNVSSFAGLTGGKAGPHYAAAKGGMISFTRHLARRYARDGIVINAVAPNSIETDLLSEMFSESMREQMAEAIPVGRLGTAEETAFVIAFLCSDEASYVIGECVTIAGGA